MFRSEGVQISLLRAGEMFATILTVPILLRLLGAHDYGLWATGYALVSSSFLLDFGVGAALRNSITIALTNRNTTIAAQVIRRAVIITALLGLAYFLATAIAASLYLTFYRPPHLGWREILAATMILGLISFGSLANIIPSSLNGALRPVIPAAQRFTQSISFPILLLILHSTQGAPGDALLLVGLAFSIAYISNTVAYYFVARNIIFRDTPSLPPAPVEKYKIRPDEYGYFALQSLAFIMFSLDRPIIAALLGVKSVAAYDIYYKIFFSLAFFHGAFITPLWGRIASAKSRGAAQEFRRHAIEAALALGVMLLLGIITIFALPLILETLKFPEPRQWGLAFSFLAFAVSLMSFNTVSGVLSGASRIRMQIRPNIYAACFKYLSITGLLGFGLLNMPCYVAVSALQMLPLIFFGIVEIRKLFSTQA